ncbi:MAG: glycosyltransferase [Pseudomonadota bacterium]
MRVPRVLFYVQHLLGIGHVVRAARIVRAMAGAGLDVCVASGGKPVEGMDWGGARIAQLPAVQAAPGGFSDLVTADSQPIDEAYRQERRARLLGLLSEFRPDILLIEAYPFARRIMRFELKPLLEAAHAASPRPLVVSSIRDILQEGRKPERIEETTGLVRNWFDAVLVHGDPEFAPLDLSFPQVDKIADKIHYTGMVAAERSHPSAETYDVIVTAGGGAVGHALFNAALKAQPICSLHGARWLVLAGPNLPGESYGQLGRDLPANVSLQRFRADVPALLRSATLSISQAGYNTMADILSAGCRSVVVPFAAGGETEQTRRAELLAAKGATTSLAESDLSGPALERAIDAAMAQNPVSAGLNLRGAEQTAEVLLSLSRSNGAYPKS